MSTNNYTGLRFDTANGVTEALDVLAGQKKSILDLCNDKMTGWIAGRATAFVDALLLRQAAERGQLTLPSQSRDILEQKDDFYTFVDEADRPRGLEPVLKDTYSPVIRSFREIDDRQTKCRTKPTRDVDIDCDVQLFVHWDPAQKCLLAHMQEEGVGARKQLLTASGIKDYSYHNSTDDLPKGVSRKAYDLRGKVWEDANRNPASLTFTVAWQPDWRPDNTSDLFHHLETAEKRALRFATRESQNRYMEEHYKPSSTGGTGRVAGLLFDHQDLLKDENSQQRKDRDALAKVIVGFLPDGKLLQAALDMRLCDLVTEAPRVRTAAKPKP